MKLTLKRAKSIFGVPAASAKINPFAMEPTKGQALNLFALQQKSLEKRGFADANKQKALPFVIAPTSRLIHEKVSLIPSQSLSCGVQRDNI
jgi:hypothetical protein